MSPGTLAGGAGGIARLARSSCTTHMGGGGEGERTVRRCSSAQPGRRTGAGASPSAKIETDTMTRHHDVLMTLQRVHATSLTQCCYTPTNSARSLTSAMDGSGNLLVWLHVSWRVPTLP